MLNKSNLVGLISVLAIAGWMVSGNLSSAENIKASKPAIGPKIYTVRVQKFDAESVEKSIKLNGRTQPYLTVTVASEIEGKITHIHAKRGHLLNAGDLIAKIDVGNLQDDLDYALADLKQKEVELAGAQKLANRGFQGKVQLEKLHTEYMRVKNQVARLKRAIDKSYIRSPQDGVMNERFIEVGDYVSVGDSVAGIERLQPIIISAEVTEKEIYLLAKEQQAIVTTLDNRVIAGHISYLSKVSDKSTNTFTVEVEIPNEDHQLYAGTSAKVTLPLGSEKAIKVSPSILVLDKNGDLGVKTVSEGKVEFNPIEILQTEHDGVWLRGLHQSDDIIVLGQGFVSIGEVVNTARVDGDSNG